MFLWNAFCFACRLVLRCVGGGSGILLTFTCFETPECVNESSGLTYVGRHCSTFIIAELFETLTPYQLSSQHLCTYHNLHFNIWFSYPKFLTSQWCRTSCRSKWRARRDLSNALSPAAVACTLHELCSATWFSSPKLLIFLRCRTSCRSKWRARRDLSNRPSLAAVACI